MKKIMISAALLATTASMAATCNSITECTEKISAKTKKKYVWGGDLKSSGRFEIDISKSNGEELYSHMLATSGYTRIAISSDTYEIINARDIRYREVPIVMASKNKKPTFREGNDHYMMKYKLVSNKVPASSIARNFRPFMSRYGRIIDIAHSGTVIISDRAKNLKRLYQLLGELDIELSDKEYKRYVRSQEKRRECHSKK